MTQAQVLAQVQAQVPLLCYGVSEMVPSVVIVLLHLGCVSALLTLLLKLLYYLEAVRSQIFVSHLLL